MSTTLDLVTYPVLSVKARPIRRVRTPEGARYYGLPMHAIIKPDAVPAAAPSLAPAAVTRQEFLAAWHDDLSRLAVGRNLGKPADRSAFRADVIDRLKGLDDDNLDALLEDLDGADAPDKRRAVADAYIAAAHDAEAEAGEQYDLFGSIEDDTVPLIPVNQPEHATQAVEDVTKSLQGQSDAAPEPEDMDIVADPLEFDVPNFRLEAVDAMLAKANRRAERAGIPDRLSYEVISTRTEEVQKRDAAGEPLGLPTLIERSTIRLNVPAVKHEGFTFIATLAWDEEAGLIARTAPGQTLGKHAPEARECNVCNSVRDRKDTFVVREDATGKTTQVGRNCLQQFMGITPGNLWLLTFAEDFAKELKTGEDEEGGGGLGGGGERRYDSHAVMALAWAVVKDKGWVSRAQAEAYNSAGGRKQATVDAVRDAIDPPTGKGTEDVRRWAREMRDQAEQYGAEAQSVIDMAAAFDGDSDYESNLRALAGAKTVSDRNLAMWVSAIAGKIKRDEQAAERAAREKSVGASKHFGAVGDKIGKAKGAAIPPITAQVTGVRVSEGNYGMTTLLTMVTSDGNVVKWWASGNLDGDYSVGDPVLITGGSIKSHGEYQGVPETALTRVKMEVTSDAAEQKRRDEQARADDAASRSNHDAPGITPVVTGANGNVDYATRRDLISRLKVGSRVRVNGEQVPVKRGRGWDYIQTFQNVTLTDIEADSPHGGSGVVKYVDENGEPGSINVNGIVGYDETTVAPIGEPLGEAAPAGMKRLAPEDADVLTEGHVVRFLDRGEIGDDGVWRRPYVDAYLSHAPQAGTHNFSGGVDLATGKSVSFQRPDIIAVGGTPVVPADYSGLSLTDLIALGRERDLPDYAFPDARTGDRKATENLIRSLLGQDRGDREKAAVAGRPAPTPKTAPDTPGEPRAVVLDASVIDAASYWIDSHIGAEAESYRQDAKRAAALRSAASLRTAMEREGLDAPADDLALMEYALSIQPAGERADRRRAAVARTRRAAVVAAAVPADAPYDHPVSKALSAWRMREERGNAEAAETALAEAEALLDDAPAGQADVPVDLAALTDAELNRLAYAEDTESGLRDRVRGQINLRRAEESDRRRAQRQAAQRPGKGHPAEDGDEGKRLSFLTR